ncbi:MAG: hypothetical protein EA416_16425 [Trueperaceae bacterium]|nr:MAG: hypothetical protein EA416_16425 [Trueperaceae bacterium]
MSTASVARCRPFAAVVALVATAVVLAACGGPAAPSDPGPGPGGGGPPPEDPIAATLETLGVDTAASPRKAPDGSTLGDDDAPLGASASLGAPTPFSAESGAHPHMELVIANPEYFGSTPEGTSFEVRKIVNAAVTPTGDIEPGSEEVLADLSDGNDWALPDGTHTNQFQTRRAVAAGDLDGDGFDEIAAIFVDPSDDVLKLRVFDDAEAGFTARTSSLGAGASIRGLALIAYDANGDGRDGLTAAISYQDRVELIVLTGSVSGAFTIDADTITTLEPQIEGSILYVRMDAGQLDYDQGLELGVVVNEATGSSSGATGLATYYLFDDANAGRALMRSGLVQANVGGIVTAAAADIKLADVDGDGLDEVILAGATNLATSCGDPFAALMIALDDAPREFAQLGATVESLLYQNCPNYAAWKRLFVFLTTPDLDGDGVHEIVANHVVFDNFVDAAPFTRLEDVEIPRSAFFANQDDGQYMSLATMDMIAADVTGDGRQNVLLYHQNRGTMPVWGISAVSSIGAAGNGWAQLSEVAMPGTLNPGGTARPIVVPADVDLDGPVLKYGAGSHELIFTEPLIIAAMATPPCQEGIEQNHFYCVTRFGQGTSTGTDASLTVSITAGVTTGIDATVNVPFVGDVGVQMRNTVTAKASTWAGAAYTVRKTIVYTAGSLEDAVVFTSIPYDVYRYDIVSHPDPELVGMQVVVRVPREPVTMIAERTFFNDALPSDATPIGSNVFDHTPGDLSSYPSVSRKNQLRSQHGGIEFGPSGVGQGGGDTELEIAVSTEISAGGSLAIEYEKTVEATGGGAIAGYSVGYGAEAALTITSGSQTTYTGVVGSISAADFAEHAYSWGIFTYVQGVGGQQIEVINFWVE